MCPACITTAAVVAASSASGVGVLGFLLLKFRSSRRSLQCITTTFEGLRETEFVNEGEHDERHHQR
jgi:hypothetical protein